jgi:fructokinase
MAAQPTIVAVGEILWDLFPEGPRFGGAPANFACHAAGLGGAVAIVSAVGPDDLGRSALGELNGRSIETRAVTIAERPTGTVRVTVDAVGKASFEFASDIAWDHLGWSENLDLLAARAQAVCFGTLAQRSEISRATVQRFVAATSPPALRVFDVNLRPPYYGDEVIRQSLGLANVLKLNDDELPVVARIARLSGPEVRTLAGLCDQFNLNLVALTRGSRGSLLISRTGEANDHPGVPTTVQDTVGAGDAFTAVLTLGLLRGDSLATINDRANRVAAWVCSQPGATPVLPAQYRAMSG